MTERSSVSRKLIAAQPHVSEANVMPEPMRRTSKEQGGVEAADSGRVAEWSNAPDSKSGVPILRYRGFESHPFRQDKGPMRALLFWRMRVGEKPRGFDERHAGGMSRRTPCEARRSRSAGRNSVSGRERVPVALATHRLCHPEQREGSRPCERLRFFAFGSNDKRPWLRRADAHWFKVTRVLGSKRGGATDCSDALRRVPQSG